MPKTENLNAYELTFILEEKADQEVTQKKTTFVSQLVTKFGGKVTKEESWGRRELAYPIKRNRTGFYVTLWFDLPADQVKPLEQELRFDEQIIRSLVTKAYLTAQPGTLSPVAEEEEKHPKREDQQGEDKSSAEEMLRRSSGVSPKKGAKESSEDELPEEERLKKLDETLEEMLKDDKEETPEA